MTAHAKKRHHGRRNIVSRSIHDGVVIRLLDCGHSQPQPGVATNHESASALAARAWCRICLVSEVGPEPGPVPMRPAPTPPTVKQYADAVREVWNPSSGKPWTQLDLCLARLLRAIDEREKTKGATP